jgi:hypothetical protein
MPTRCNFGGSRVCTKHSQAGCRHRSVLGWVSLSWLCARGPRPDPDRGGHALAGEASMEVVIDSWGLKAVKLLAKAVARPNCRLSRLSCFSFGRIGDGPWRLT